MLAHLLGAVINTISGCLEPVLEFFGEFFFALVKFQSFLFQIILELCLVVLRKGMYHIKTLQKTLDYLVFKDDLL